MREIDDAREALDRVETSVERWRWIFRNPRRARELLENAILESTGDDAAAVNFVILLDEARRTPPPGGKHNGIPVGDCPCASCRSLMKAIAHAA